MTCLGATLAVNMFVCARALLCVCVCVARGCHHRSAEHLDSSCAHDVQGSRPVASKREREERERERDRAARALSRLCLQSLWSEATSELSLGACDPRH